MSREYNELCFDDLCNLISLEIGKNVTPNTVKRFLRATYKVILRQLELNKRVSFRTFGTFEIKERASGERYVGNPTTGGRMLVYVPPRNSIYFKPSELFDISVNENNFKIARNTNKKKEAKKRREREKRLSEISKESFNDIMKKADERAEKND